MPLLDKNIFINSINSIFHICLITVHSDMMKKLDNDIILLENPKIQPIKSMNMRQSIRKKYLFENYSILKIDVHLNFVEAFKV